SYRSPLRNARDGLLRYSRYRACIAGSLQQPAGRRSPGRCTRQREGSLRMSNDMDDLRDLYRELILDHAKSPRHFGKLEDATHMAQGINPLCGDKLQMYFSVDENNRISDARFEGSGCAISVASASLLTETVIGLDTERALQIFAAMVRTLSGHL